MTTIQERIRKYRKDKDKVINEWNFNCSVYPVESNIFLTITSFKPSIKNIYSCFSSYVEDLIIQTKVFEIVEEYELAAKLFKTANRILISSVNNLLVYRHRVRENDGLSIFQLAVDMLARYNYLICYYLKDMSLEEFLECSIDVGFCIDKQLNKLKPFFSIIEREIHVNQLENVEYPV